MIISIDIGTSYSRVCLLNLDGRRKTIDISSRIGIYGEEYSIPSVVFVDDNDKVLVGQEAMNGYKKMPQNFRSEFKRDLGQNFPIVLGNKNFLPEDFYMELFRHMKEYAEEQWMGEIEKAYITFPSSFGKTKREKIVQAARKAGLFDTELVDELTAVAMCYGEKGILEESDVLLVCDFGGGTFDAAVIKYEAGEYELLVPAERIEHCGGIDIDRIIYSDIYSKIDSELLRPLLINEVNRRRFEGQLVEHVVKIKHQLSTVESVYEDIAVGFDVLEYHLSRSELERMISYLLMQIIDCCRNILSNAGLSVSEISKVLLSGGTSRMPLVQKMVQNFAAGISIYADSSPELMAVHGALLMEMKNPAMQFKLGWNYIHDDEEPDYNKAKEWYEKAAEQGYAPAQHELGELYSKGVGVEQDYKKAAEWYEKAAEQGYAAAQYEMGKLHQKGLGVEQDYTKALEWYRKAAEQGYAIAQFAIGIVYEEGVLVSQDFSKAAEWYWKAAVQGLVDGQARRGLLCMEGRGVERDLDEAEAWLIEAQKQGHLDSMYYLGVLYRDAVSNYDLVEYWWKKAAEQGHLRSQFYLGRLYAEAGRYEEAGYWWGKAAEQEEMTAQYNLGSLYYWTYGDIESARYWWKKAAEQGYDEAQYYLGSSYFDNGSYIEKAKYWWRKAAEQGNEKAKGMLNLVGK